MSRDLADANIQELVGKDWPRIYEEIINTQEEPLSHQLLARYLRNASRLDKDQAWRRVLRASDVDELQLVAPELYPGTYRKYFFIPRPTWEPHEPIKIPFWDYITNEVESVVYGLGEDSLTEYIYEEVDDDVSLDIIATIENHYEKILPIGTDHRYQNLKIRSDMVPIYNFLKKQDEVPRYSSGEMALSTEPDEVRKL